MTVRKSSSNDTGPRAEHGSERHSDSGSDDSVAVETLVAGRARRDTAGKRMAQLIAREEDEDELSLLFAQGDEQEDVEFIGSDDDASDVQLGSSSDEEDQEPNATTGNDLEGEKELQRDLKSQKSKKRKAQDAFTTVAGLRKKTRINPKITLDTPPSSRPTKKADRVSWLPVVEEGPVRASGRKSTVANKEVTHARLKDYAAKRAKVLEQMRKAEHEREKQRPEVITQEDRLAAAAETEKNNSQSLSHWEETERRRAEEQAAKLAALKTRKLEGPVVSWWSGVATWLGTKLTRVGPKETNQEMLTEPKRRGRKPKSSLEVSNSLKDVKEDAISNVSTPGDQTGTPASTEPPLYDQITKPEPPSISHFDHPKVSLADPNLNASVAVEQDSDHTFLQRVQEYASMPSESNSARPSHAPSDGADTGTAHIDYAPSPNGPSQEPAHAQMPRSTRNLVILSNFEGLSPSERGNTDVFYNTRKGSKLTKATQSLCPITSLPARYRDPDTDVAYANATAYRTLQELKQSKHIWSTMLECYIGTTGLVARGVPDGFVSAA